MRRILFCVMVFWLGSCVSKKEVLYWQDLDQSKLEELDKVFYSSRIGISDILYIGIAAEDQESIEPFEFRKSSSGGGQVTNIISLKLEGYLVDQKGNINFPQLGEIYVRGKTLKELEIEMQERLSRYIKNPTVIVRLVNNKVTVLGAINSPGTYELQEEAITLPQLLGMAGDLSIRGKRQNVTIIRTEGARRIVKEIDLTKSDWMNSPFYYMKQNDLVYVEPNDPQVKTAGHITGLGQALSVISFTLSLAILIFK